MNSFLVPGQGPYLLTHSVGCLPRVARDALDSNFLRPWAERGGNAWPDWLQQVDGFRSALADLFGGAAAEYCPQSNLSSGLAKLLLALPPSGKRTLLAAEDSFPSLGFVLRQAERHGFTLRLMPRAQPPDDVRSWSEALTSDVRVALVTHVHSNTGRVAPLAEVAKLCAEREILCIADVAQSAGILPMSFPALGAGIVLGSCIKWLCGGPGAGYLWIRPQLIGQLEPVDVGWFSHEDPFEMDIHSFKYANDTRRFWGGTPSVAPFVCAAASLRHIRELGVEKIHAHNRRLIQAFKDALLPPWRARLPAWPTGGTLCIPLAAEFQAVTSALNSLGAQFDSRGDVIRLSFHACNAEDDALRIARAWQGGH
ncbi:MAG TPA: aminotransferase class V-fold PLP-dependent enzyme [Steroidobacteraceae bacterium]|nr:aminotransferase class V-fold PLP-dependent enzyme [Steroidobacteraceae bacterium]